MTKEFLLEIIEKRRNGEDYFLQSDKYIVSYKLVVLYSLFKAIKSNKLDSQKFQEHIRRTFECLYDSNYKSYVNEYFSVFSFLDEQSTCLGVFLVTREDICFPLVFYGDKVDSKGLRADAFQASMKQMCDKADELFKIIQEADEWNKELQNQILEQIKDP